MQSDLKEEFTKKAKEIFQGNLRQGFSRWKNTNYKFISPASEEYIYQWLWDTGFHAIVLSHFDTTWAKNEITNFLISQEEDGFLPHIIFWGGNTISLPHWAFIESKSSLRPHATAITQPPVFALSIEEIYSKDPDKNFLQETLPKIAKYHRWLLNNRDPDCDKLISIISPNESGMDELPVFQVAFGFLGNSEVKLRYSYRKVDLKNYFNNFNSIKILKKDYFNVEELLFNCCFIESSRSLARLFAQIGNENELKFFQEVADEAEKNLLEKCWNQEDKIFYSLYSAKERQARVKTVASFLPLFLDGLKGEKLELLIKNHLLNPKEFWTSYPVPSVALDEPYYSSVNLGGNLISGTSLLWRGPTWMNTNWFIIKGLRKHGKDEIADQIVAKMIEMIQKEGFREYYNPETGEGYRRENFGWSTLILDLL